MQWKTTFHASQVTRLLKNSCPAFFLVELPHIWPTHCQKTSMTFIFAAMVRWYAMQLWWLISSFPIPECFQKSFLPWNELISIICHNQNRGQRGLWESFVSDNYYYWQTGSTFYTGKHLSRSSVSVVIFKQRVTICRVRLSCWRVLKRYAAFTGMVFPGWPWERPCGR